MVVAILATLKTGAAYVPIDGAVVTHATLEHILEDSQCCAVVCSPEFRSKISPSARYCVLDLQELQRHEHNRDCGSYEEAEAPGDGAYVIYTSGKHFLRLSAFFSDSQE